jgi:hypothetical protein
MLVLMVPSPSTVFTESVRFAPSTPYHDTQNVSRTTYWLKSGKGVRSFRQISGGFCDIWRAEIALVEDHVASLYRIIEAMVMVETSHSPGC